MNIMGLVQLCETAEPIDALGEGLERIAHLSDPQQVAPVIEEILETAVTPGGGVASGIAYRAARSGDFEKLPQVCAVMSSPRMPVDLRRTSVQMGERLWGRSRGWQWAISVHEQLDGLIGPAEMHHAVAFGALVSETTSSQPRAIATYLFNVARSLVLAAVRGVPLDEVEGQRVLARVQPRITELAMRCVDKEVGDIWVGG